MGIRCCKMGAVTRILSNLSFVSCVGTRNNKARNVILICMLCIFLVYTMSMDETYPYDDVPLVHHNVHSVNLVEEPNIKKTFCEIYNMSKDYIADFKCVRTKTSPPTAVCLYDSWRDMYISHDLEDTGMWEPQIIQEVQEVLRRDPDQGFLDIGAHIGFYSLVAANMGHQVVAVEPFLDSCYRMHRAAVLQKTVDRITLVRNAIADQRILATIRASGDNQGDTRIKMEAKPCIGSCLPTIRTILLNDLLEVTNFTKAVMVLDIQGFEHKAFQHADLLLDKIQISFIFMEWLLMRSFHVSDNETSSDHFIVEEMLELLFKKDYRPYALSSEGGSALDPREWNTWPNDIVWHKMLNEKEREKVMRNHFLNWPQ